MKAMNSEHHIQVDNDVVECNFIGPPTSAKPVKTKTNKPKLDVKLDVKPDLSPLAKVVDETLKRRCQRKYGWTPAFTDRVAKGYTQFLELKLAVKDFSANKVEPTLFVSQMWTAHILDTRKYMADCMLHFDGQLIHHDPDVDTDPLSRSRRLETTKIALQARFDQLDRSVWVFETEITNEPQEPPAPVCESPSTDSCTSQESSSDDEAMIVPVVNMDGKVTNFKMLGDQELGVLFARYAERLGADRDEVRFVLNGQTLYDVDTPKNLNLTEDDRIHALLEETD
eukprot:CAMPEP_0194048194 /NCGR_PEP_ID=MMETSP0009_2-20130614/26779_1 /TAXON_ID=210454 /ORGANISM="Grammatophora oceanica, Strain CCMP 410" /LENGTH=282 /DNA_ID=CAMNT_0038694009 /DNA_START=47 /DNA_END=895 /DNA_ORIENTATION=+